MSESEIEGFINKVESGLVEAQHDMLVEKALYNRPVVISDGNGGVVEVSAKQLLNQIIFYHSFNQCRPLPLLYPSASDFQIRYAPVAVGSGRAAWFSLRSASSLSFGRRDKAAEQRRCRLRISPYNQGSIRHLFIVAYRPLSFPVRCGGN